MNLGSPPLHWRGLVLLYGCLVTLLFGFFFLSRPSLLSLLALKVYDSMLQALPRGSGQGGPVIVDLDEKTLAEFGQWPWPRYRVAQLLDRLNRLAPKAVGLDILFAEPDRTSLHILRQELQRDFAVNLNVAGLPPALANNDQTLASTLQTGPFVLGYKFLFAADGPPGRERLLHPLSVDAPRGQAGAGGSGLFTAHDAITNIAELSAAVSSSGFLNNPADPDGVVRRVPLLIRFRGQIYPSLALAAVLRALGRKNVVLAQENGQLRAVLVDNHPIPVDAAGNLLLAYQGKHGFFATLSAADILNGRVSREQIAGRIVLVGTTATGLVDMHPSPLDPLYPGVEVHATVVDNLLNRHFLSRPPWTEGAELGIVFLLGLLSTLSLAVTPPLFSVMFLLLGAGGLWYGSFLLLREQNIFINPFWPVLVLFVNFALLNLLKFWREEREVTKRTRELLLAQDTAILSMTALAETRDNETGGHIFRTQHYVRALAEHLARQPKYKKQLDWSAIDLLFRSAPLHDIGKVGVADRILLHPGKLSAADFAEMQKHTIYGHETLLKAQSLLGDNQGHSFLQMAGEIAHSHHEKWDGSGYPQGLRGEEIPLAGRLMALADVYDALVSARRYKPPFSHQDAVRLIEQGSGSHFDPEVVQAFIALESTFQAIAGRFADKAFAPAAVPPSP